MPVAIKSHKSFVHGKLKIKKKRYNRSVIYSKLINEKMIKLFGNSKSNTVIGHVEFSVVTTNENITQNP